MTATAIVSAAHVRVLELSELLELSVLSVLSERQALYQANS
jgi:hypothetical protein